MSFLSKVKMAFGAPKQFSDAEPTKEFAKKVESAVQVFADTAQADGTVNTLIDGKMLNMPLALAHTMKEIYDSQKVKIEHLQERLEAADKYIRDNTMTPERATEFTQVRTAVIDRARKLDPSIMTVNLDGKDKVDIMAMGIKGYKKDIDFECKSDDQIESIFDTLFATLPTESERQAAEFAQSQVNDAQGFAEKSRAKFIAQQNGGE